MTEKYTWEEIRKHNEDTDCWVVLYDQVLDVTSFLNRHPGGLDPICDLGGYDITNTFEAIGHSEKAQATYKKFIIGVVDKDSKPPKVERKAVKQEGDITKVAKTRFDSGPDVKVIAAVVLVAVALYFFAM